MKSLRTYAWACLAMLALPLATQSQTVARNEPLPGQTITTVRTTELRADKLGSAPVLQSLAGPVVLHQ